MARILTGEIFQGPFSTPFREADRFRGWEGLQETPERIESGNLPAQPAGLPMKPLGERDGPVPYKNLRNGRGG